MKTQTLPVKGSDSDAAAIAQAAEAIRAGRLVAFPTETVYGLGANALDPAAIKSIYTAKGRPANNPLIVHIATLEQLEIVAVAIPPLAYQLAEQFWPGPLTLVLKRHAQVPGSVSLGRDTVAVRMPSHPVAQALIAAAGVPVVAPSANRFTRPSATTAQHVLADLNGRVDIVLDAGPTPIGLESTVLDLTADVPTVLRPGGVTLEQLQVCLPVVRRLEPVDDASARPASPGMLAKHYSPEAEVLLFSGPADTVMAQMQQAAQTYMAQGRRVVVLVTDEEQALFSGLPVYGLGPVHDLAQVGQNLFAALRTLDERGVEVIITRLFDPAGLGTTLNDRLLRAAEGKIAHVTG